jgi:hypothetical protein
MSDPNYTDPRFAPPPRDNELRSDQRLNELESSNAMWGWVAGGIVLALVLMFVFSNTGTSTNTASVDSAIPPATTTLAPPRTSTPAPPANVPATPSTSAQGSSSTTTGSGGSNNQ